MRLPLRVVPLPPGIPPAAGPIGAVEPQVPLRVDGDVRRCLLVDITPALDIGVVHVGHETVGRVPRPIVRVVVLLTLVDAGVQYGLYESVGVGVDGYVAFRPAVPRLHAYRPGNAG